MSSQDEKPTRKFKRKLTPFLCQEMLYDYELERLDGERRTAVDDLLQKDRDCQVSLEDVRRGMKYTDQLAGMKLNPELAAQLRESENAVSLGRRYSSWKEWPESLRWSLTAIFLSIMVAGFVAVVPWSRLPSFGAKKTDAIQLAELPHASEQQLEAAKDHQEGDIASAEQGSGDEEIEAPDNQASVKPNASAPVKIAKVEKPKAAAEASEDSSGDNESDDSSSGDAGEDKAEAATQVAAAHAGAHENKAKGFVYRAFMTLADLEEIGPKITDNITELGGAKAGEVELGWKRGTGRYYHFALPEENEEKLLERLRAYGPVRISKDPHPRVMPQGQVRFILWVESAH